jgi:hypothetical protein
MDTGKAWDFLVENGVASEETLRVVTNINGYSVETLEDVLYAVTGMRDFDQYMGADFYELPDSDFEEDF